MGAGGHQAGKQILHQDAVTADVQIIVLKQITVAENDDALLPALEIAFQCPAERQRPFRLALVRHDDARIGIFLRPALLARPQQHMARPVAGRRAVRIIGERDRRRQQWRLLDAVADDILAQLLHQQQLRIIQSVALRTGINHTALNQAQPAQRRQPRRQIRVPCIRRKKQTAAAREIRLQRAAMRLRNLFRIGDDQHIDTARNLHRARLILIRDRRFRIAHLFIRRAPVTAAVLPVSAFAVPLQMQNLHIARLAEIQQRLGNPLRAGNINPLTVCTVGQKQLPLTRDLARLHPQRIRIGIDKFQTQIRLQYPKRRDQITEPAPHLRIIAYKRFQHDFAVKRANRRLLLRRKLQQRLIAQHQRTRIMQRPPGTSDNSSRHQYRQQPSIKKPKTHQQTYNPKTKTRAKRDNHAVRGASRKPL